MTADVQRELAELLFEAQRADNGSGSVARAEMLAAAILPVVERAEKRAAARALRPVCGALVLRNLNAIEQHRRHDGLIAVVALASPAPDPQGGEPADCCGVPGCVWGHGA